MTDRTGFTLATVGLWFSTVALWQTALLDLSLPGLVAALAWVAFYAWTVSFRP